MGLKMWRNGMQGLQDVALLILLSFCATLYTTKALPSFRSGIASLMATYHS